MPCVACLQHWIPNAKASPASRALDGVTFSEAFPYSQKDLNPMLANEGLFYVIQFVQHAGGECRASLTDFYRTVL